MSARVLLDQLAAQGVHVALSASGDSLALSGPHRPPPDLLAAVRIHKPELLATLKGVQTVDAPVSDLQLPAHLSALLVAARAGQLPSGPVTLVSGLVTDLGAYVLAWGESWPGDKTHTLRRLEEAHAAWGRR